MQRPDMRQLTPSAPISDRIAVMYLGRIVKIATRDELYKRPMHPCTEALLSAVQVADVDAESRRKRVVVKGEVPRQLGLPSGCRFHPRCPMAMEKCSVEETVLRDHGTGHVVACHLHS